MSRVLIYQGGLMDSTLLFIFIGIFIGLVKGGLTGPIGGAIILPLLSQTMPVPQAAGLTLPLLIVGDFFAMRFYWREWDLKLVKLLLPAALIGIIIGISLLSALPNNVLRPMLGILSLGIIAYKVAGDLLTSVEYQPRSWHGYLAGFLSGLMSALANSGGPPITAYLLLQKLKPTAFVGTMTLFFFIVNLLKVPGYLSAHFIDVPKLISIAWVIPSMPLSVFKSSFISYSFLGWAMMMPL